MKLDFIYDTNDMENRVLTGIDRKVLSQVDCFNHQGIECLLVCPPRAGNVAKIAQSLPFIHDRTRWLSMPRTDADALYIRKPVYFSEQFMGYLKRIGEQRPGMPILLEIPTYPYDAELANIKQGAILLKDRHHREKLKKYVDRIVTVGNDSVIFGIETIRIHNGVDLATIEPRSKHFKTDDPIDIICVANYQRWHGVDRFIEGLGNSLSLLNTKQIRIHLFGDGPTLNSLKTMVSQFQLNESVIFYGQCNQAQMDSIYDKCSLAVASLGLHRIGIDVASTLKTREYLAKGMPFIYSGEIDVFQDEPVDFCLQVPADESPIDIGEVVRFHDELYARESEEDLIARIRNYAERHVGMDAAMKPVIDYIKENCTDEK